MLHLHTWFRGVLLIFRHSQDEHWTHLHQVLSLLSANGLVINTAKCVFAVSSLEFLGHQITSAGVVPLSRHVDAIQHFPQPKDIKQLQRYLGIVNFYRHFLRETAVILKPLTEAFAGNPNQLIWSDSQNIPLDKLRYLSSRRLFSFTQTSIPDCLWLLMSQILTLEEPYNNIITVFGNVLHSSPGNSHNNATRHFIENCSALFSASGIFVFFLKLDIFFSDCHKPLVTALTKVSPPWSARQQLQLSYIAEFTADIRYIPGSTNIVAYALSRSAPGEASTSVPQLPLEEGQFCFSIETDVNAKEISYQDMATRQLQCPEVQQIQSYPNLKISSALVQCVLLFGDTSAGIFRHLAPVDFRRAVFETIHNPAHPRMRATRRLISSRFLPFKRQKSLHT